MAIGEVVARYRAIPGAWTWLRFALAISAMGLAVVNIFGIVVAGQVMYSMAYFGLLTSLLLPLIFLFMPATKKAPRDRVPWYDIVLAVASFIGPFVVFVYAKDIEEMGWSILAPSWAIYFGFMTWLLVLEALRRAASLPMMIIVTAFSFYPLLASKLPGILEAGEYSLGRLVRSYYLTDNGIWGFVTNVYARIIIGYMIFAAALMQLGGAHFFLNLAQGLMGRLRGGPAKVAILSSAFFATMSGSAIANVVSTGSFTIPTMKKSGYPPYYAAAIESCASTGGVLTPPVMGSVAFLMADFLEISYATVCLAAIIPALLYYVALFSQTDFYAAKTGLRGMRREEIPSLARTLKDGWHFLLAVVVLIYFIYWRLTGQAPFFAAGALIFFGVLRKVTRPGKQDWAGFFGIAGSLMAELLAIIVAVGLIIGSLSITGLAHGLTSLLTQLAGGSVFLLLCLGALASFVMGMGMSIGACYIFLAILLVPALVNNGVYPIAAHLFVIYWGMISFITPPVALAVFAASSLAGSEITKTGWRAVRLGFIGYIVPFLFVFNTALVSNGSPLDIFSSIAVAIIGIVLLSALIEGYLFFTGTIGWFTRVIFGMVGAVFLIPHVEILWVAIGTAVVIALVVWTRLRPKKPQSLIQQAESDNKEQEK